MTWLSILYNLYLLYEILPFFENKELWFLKKSIIRNIANKGKKNLKEKYASKILRNLREKNKFPEHRYSGICRDDFKEEIHPINTI